MKSCAKGHVTFGGGTTVTVVGNGKLNVSSLPVLDNILLVEGPKSNLISIRQLCDQDMIVTFTKKRLLGDL